MSLLNSSCCIEKYFFEIKYIIKTNQHEISHGKVMLNVKEVKYIKNHFVDHILFNIIIYLSILIKNTINR